MPTSSHSFHYVTHARTLEELRAEFLSDIERRRVTLARLASRESQAAKAARFGVALFELDDLAEFWQKVQFGAGQRRRREAKKVEEVKE